MKGVTSAWEHVTPTVVGAHWRTSAHCGGTVVMPHRTLSTGSATRQAAAPPSLKSCRTSCNAQQPGRYVG